jgi:hypothetical protein
MPALSMAMMIVAVTCNGDLLLRATCLRRRINNKSKRDPAA